MDDPNQILGNVPNKPKLLTSSLEIFDFNILPERYQRRKIRLIALLPWMLFLIFLSALYPSFLLAQEALSVYKQTEFEATVLQTSLETYQSAANEMTALEDQIISTTELRDQILDSYQGIDLQGSNWSPTLFKIDNTIPEDISWTSIIQLDQEISLEGIASTYQGVLDLKSRLTDLGKFSDVRIDTIDQVITDPSEVVVEYLEDGQSPLSIQPTYNFLVIVSLKAGGQQ
jgi:Tfp pilus assembly protein PilN